MYSKYVPKKFVPGPPRAQFVDKPYIPNKSVDDGCISSLLSIVQDGDYNKIKNFVSEKNLTYDLTNSDGENAVHLILKSSFTDMSEKEKLKRIQFFADNGASLSSYNKQNITPIHLAAKFQYPTIIKYLLEKGVTVNALDNSNMNALHYAVQGNIVECKKTAQEDKVGKLIPGDVSKDDNENHRKELRELGASITDILKTKNIKNYVDHIGNLMGELDHMYPEKMTEFEESRKKSAGASPEVVKQTNERVAKDISKFVEDKLAKPLTNVDISEESGSFILKTEDDVKLEMDEETEKLKEDEVKLQDELKKLENNNNIIKNYDFYISYLEQSLLPNALDFTANPDNEPPDGDVLLNPISPHPKAENPQDPINAGAAKTKVINAKITRNKLAIPGVNNRQQRDYISDADTLVKTAEQETNTLLKIFNRKKSELLNKIKNKDKLDEDIDKKQKELDEIQLKLDSIDKRYDRLFTDLPQNATNKVLYAKIDSEEKYPTPTYINKIDVGGTLKEESLTGSVLNYHLTMVKEIIINNIVEIYKANTLPVPNPPSLPSDLAGEDKLIDRIKAIKQSLSETYKQEQEVTGIAKNMIYAVTRMSDEIVMNLIRNKILKGANKLSGVPLTPTVAPAPTAASTSDEPISDLDRNFSLNFNKLLDEIINKFSTGPVPEGQDKTGQNKDYTALGYTSKIMKDNVGEYDPDKEPEQQEVMNVDYNNMQEITERKCYDIKPETIDALIKGRINVNQKDKALNTPLFYAIDTAYPRVVQSIASANAEIYRDTARNKAGFTPLEHALNAFARHSSDDGRNVLTNLYENIHKSIEDSIISNKAYANNIILYMNNIFPQLIMMYNHILSNSMSSFRYGWTRNDSDALGKMLNNKNYGVIFTDPNEMNTKDVPLIRGMSAPQAGGGLLDLIRKGTNLGVLSNMKSDDKQKLTNLNKRLTEYEKRVINYELDKERYDKELKELIIETGNKNRSTAEQNAITNLSTKVKDLDIKIKNLEKDVEEAKKEKKIIEDNLEKRSKVVTKDVQGRVDKFSSTSKSVPKIYDDVFNTVTDKDYNLYNELWKDYIFNTKEDNKLMNRTNIHLAISALQRNIVHTLERGVELKKKINKTAIEALSVDFNLLNKLYKQVFVKSIRDYNELPNKYSRNENYMLTDVVDTIIHIMRSVVGTSLYLAVTKTLTQYLISVPVSGTKGKEDTLKGNEENNQNIKEQVNTISPGYMDYIINTMPRVAVKNILNVYDADKDYDPDSKLESLDDAFKNISTLIMKNSITRNIKDDSSLITNLKEYVYPYYKNLFEQFIPKMKLIIENYNRYIINESRYVNIVSILLTEAAKESGNYENSC